MTKLPVPDEYIDECDWDDYIAENLPAFSKLKGAGKVDEFQTLKVLMGLDYNSFWRDRDEELLGLLLAHQTRLEIDNEIIKNILQDARDSDQ
jgi:hypothetical protein